MIGSLIGGALKIGGSIIGGIKARKAMKRVKKNIENQQQKNDAWYNRRYNEDATQRADAQRILTMTQESIRNRNRAAAGTQAVMGGTDESVAAEKATNNEALADATSRIAAAGDSRKDAIERQYMATDQQIQGQLNNLEVGKANNIQQAVMGIGDAGAGIADGLEGAFSEYRIAKDALAKEKTEQQS